MCSSWPLLLILLRIAYAEPKQEDDISRCLSGHRTGACLQGLAHDIVHKALEKERLEILPGLELVRSNGTARSTMGDITANRTISLDILKIAEGLTKGADGRSRKKKQRRRLFYAIVLTALIAAKAAALSTAISIMVPLGLKFITILAMKALVIGKIGLVVATAFGILRLLSDSTQHTTEVIVDPPHHQKRNDMKKRAEHSYFPASLNFQKKEPYRYHRPAAAYKEEIQFSGPSMSEKSGEQLDQYRVTQQLMMQTLPPPIAIRRPPTAADRGWSVSEQQPSPYQR